MNALKEQIISKLKLCRDPEIPIDLWNLGLIYDIVINDIPESDLKTVDITMTLTTPGCSMSRSISEDVRNKIESLPFVERANITVTFSPPWQPEMMTDKGRDRLGIAPKVKPRIKQSSRSIIWE